MLGLPMFGEPMYRAVKFGDNFLKLDLKKLDKYSFSVLRELFYKA